VYAILSQIPGVFDSFLKFLEAKHASQQKSLEELRQDVGREMAKLDRVVIVFIDDIDRLTDREIRLLFQLVKANVHFPNLIYCLLFQKDIVAASLGKIISDGGDKYLRKIVQVQFDVPLPSKRQLQKILTDDLERILAQKDIEIVQDIERWNQLFPDPLWGYFENVRDVKRFLGSFEFYFNMHLNGNVLEVNPIDLVAVEALRMFDHPAFQSVGASFFRRGIEAFNLLDNDKVAEDFAAEIKLIVDEGNRDQQKKRRLDETLHFLFPQAKNNARDGREHEWLSKLRICHASHFDKYFQVNLSPGQPSARDLLFLVENSRDRSKLVQTLNESISKGSIGDFLEFIMAARDRIPAESLTSFVTALFDIADSFPHGSSLLGNDLQMDCLRIIFQRLKNETVEMRTTILWNALEATTGIGLPIRLLASEDHIKRARGTGEEFLIEEKDVQRFCAAALIKIRAIAERGTLLDSEYAAAILYRWKDWTDGTEVRTWVQKTIQTPRDARRLLTKLIAKSYIGTRMEPLLHSEAIEVFTPIETLLAAVEKSDGTSPSEEETVSIGLLTRAVELKRAGKPFAEIRPRDSRY
jgi:predicted KAP-like P-loop ATPase